MDPLVKENLSVGFDPLFFKLSDLKALKGRMVISYPRAKARGNSILIYCN
jgi:hypothetical protein